MHLPQSALRIATPLLATLLLFAGILPGTTEAQEDVGSVQTDGGGQEVLQSIFILPIAHAPFSLTL